MMIKKILSSLLIVIAAGTAALAQSGALKGKVIDKANGETIPFANVIVESGGQQIGGGQADFNGEYTIKPITPGTYTVKASYVGYQPVIVTGVLIKSDKTTYLNINMATGVDLKTFEKVEYTVPLIDPDNKSGGTVDRAKYQSMATKDITSVASTTAGVAQADEGKGINVRGQREDATDVYIDGERMIGSKGVPQQGIEQITVITGGVPAQYGDATGGIINVTTRGPSSQFFGGVEAISSSLTDKYGYNFLGYSLGGPILNTKKDSTGNSRTLLGFIVSGEISTEKDPSPSAIGTYRVNKDTLAWLEQNPIRVGKGGQGAIANSQFVRSNSMEHIAYRQNVRSNRFRLNAKIDYAPTKNLNITLGGTVDYNQYHGYAYEYALFNPSNNRLNTNNTWRLWARLTQKFSNNADANKEKTSSNITNAYYTLQAGIIKDLQITEDDTHRDNYFNYGYIGQFKRHQAYIPVASTFNENTGVIDILQAKLDTSVEFIRSDINELGANYTSQYYNLFANQPDGHFGNIYEVQANGGLINGQNASYVYGLWYNTGRQAPTYGKLDQTQFRAFTNFSADLFKTHAIKVGFEYEQQDIRAYSVSAVALWNIMRQLSVQHLSEIDTAKKKFTGYGAMSGIVGNIYEVPYRYNETEQSEFDKNLRAKLGLPIDGTTPVNIDELDPSVFNLNMFSADDLLLNGQYVSYYGYDKNGKRLKGNPSFDDFFTKKDDKGNFTRDQAAYRPIYVAGFIQDNFDFRDIKFNIGVRVDRFDANQKVLADPYVLYETYRAKDLEIQNRPSNIEDDFVVYVSDINDPKNSKVIGYRDPNSGYPPKWYDAEGKEISDPLVLANASVTGKIAPAMVDPAKSINPQKDLTSKAFKDYTPQINVMPRIGFSFPISDVANFFAHYDVLTQRPTTGYRLDPTDYFFMTSQGASASNPNLKPERTTDYELGFSQVLSESKNSALTITSFYKELRYLVNQVQMSYAYPATYTTYENVDFGTVKGLSATYDFRRTNNVQFNISYTLQFADGTGSNANSAGSLINSGSPNLRTTIPLDFDQRHNVVGNLDYHYASGAEYNGPMIFGKPLLESFGANLTARAASGSPYSRSIAPIQTQDATQNTRSQLAGNINGSRKPWQLRFDLRIDKNIPLKIGKKTEEGVRKAISMTVYLQVLNLLNTKNVLDVYRYTGSPNDDGSLSSPLYSNAIINQADPIAYRDMYAIKMNNPSNYSIPRRTRLGVSFDF